MGKKQRKLLAVCLAAALWISCAGCGAAQETKDQTDTDTETDTDAQAADTETDTGTDTDTDAQAADTDTETDGQTAETDTGTDTETGEADAETDTEEDASERTVELPDGDSLTADYTTIGGLRVEKGSHIAVVVKNRSAGYWKTVQEGMEQAVADLNEYLGYKGDDSVTLTVEGPKTETDIDGQVNILDAVLDENPTVVCLAAIDMDSCQAQLEMAEENSIPVVILDSGVASTDLVNTVVETDNREAAKEAARQMCGAIGEEGQILIVSHMSTAESSQERVAGFQEEIKENHSGVTVVRTISEPAREDDATIAEQLAEVMQNYPDLKGIFCTNEDMSEQILSLMESYADRGVKIVGFDLGQAQQEAIRDGREVGTVSQNPYGMGYVTVVAGLRASLGLANDSFIDAGYQWLDASNIDLEENRNYLYD